MLAHEVNSGQTQFSLAQITRLLIVEINRRLLHLGNLTLAVPDLQQLLVQARVVLIDALLLSLEMLKHKRLQDAEFKRAVPLEDLQDEQR